LDRYIETEMVTSLATIVLVILCIGVFIVYGNGSAFYGVVVVTLIVGFTNTWLIARSGVIRRRKMRMAKAAAQRPARPKRRRTKR
jgi:preprotein translocase subunit SecF